MSASPQKSPGGAPKRKREEAEEGQQPQDLDPFAFPAAANPEEDAKRARPDPVLAEQLRKEQAEWEKERARLNTWEKTGKVPTKNPLAHLANFTGKQKEESAAEQAARVAKKAAEEVAKVEAEQAVMDAQDARKLVERAAQQQREYAARMAEENKKKEEEDKIREEDEARFREEERILFEEWGKVPLYRVKNPAFEDHDSPEFVCDDCGLIRPRGGFSNVQLSQLGDPPMRRGLEGPWRGKLVRVHMRGFGFVNCLQIQEQYQRDVFMQASLVERLARGRESAQELGRTGIADIRVEFTLEMGSDGKLSCRDAARLNLICKKCHKQRVVQLHQEAADKAEERKRAIAAIPKVSPATARPMVAGFGDPHKKLGGILAGLRTQLGLPQPGTPGALKAPEFVQGFD
eukprot:TRINITY_DN8229_c0_g1_i1.p2 TRINITY_DN8229_c0_g1~~TRINITY_DN8229_c0_g1_i1.p2  ORF type:complete len:403 (+),score=208.17 TRINITY_DN8229_c0_g1_i1:101-1309(+)